MVVTQCAQVFQIIGRRDIDAAFTLNRFEQHSNDIPGIGSDRFDGFDVIERDADESLNQRFKACLGLAVAGRAQCGQGAAMEAVFHDDDGR